MRMRATDELKTMQPDYMLRCSLEALPKDTHDIFALSTDRDFTTPDGANVPKGSYLIVDPKDTTLQDGRMMIFYIGGGFDLRRCNVGELIWLERLSNGGTPPVIVTRKAAEQSCLGFVSMILPKPAHARP
jgi:hypothetical protein